mmetsp:Transcript_6469/g.14854  ORF Transcript_6469/g.14854 Transcript_6469/m.14854 type:complete len:582 (+) Transcript_6469:74-1819(+)
MPTKRPVPLSDAALGHKGDASGELAIGDTVGELKVKNTFIDFSPVSSPNKDVQADSHPASTAPAQVHLEHGFMNRFLESVQENMESPPDGSAEQGGRGPPSTSAARPSGFSASTPLMTPSPTSASLFGESRYQLFGGPLRDVSQPAPGLGPGSTGPASSELPLLLSVPPPVPSYSHLPPPLYSGTPGDYYNLPLLGPPGGPDYRPGAQETFGGRDFRRYSLEKDSDDDDDSEAERQQAMLAASGRTAETAPKPPPGAAHPSLGSAFHDTGSCKRCCFFPRNRCLNGYECEFCHYEHEKRKRKNKKNKKKKAGDHIDDYYGAEAVGLADLAWHPPHHGQPVSLPLPQPAPPQGPLTYQWTDGIPGQTPPPQVVPGFERMIAAAVQQGALQGEPPALATNPPPAPPAYGDPYADRYHQPQPYDLPPGPPGPPGPPLAAYPPAGLDPAAAPWIPPFPPVKNGSNGSNGSLGLPDIMSYPPPRRVAVTEELGLGLEPRPSPFDFLSGSTLEKTEKTEKPETEKAETEKTTENSLYQRPMPINVEKVSTLLSDGPNMPPPDQSPKLSSDLMAALQSDPPPPDESPT